MQGSPSVGQVFGQGVEDHCPPLLWGFVFLLPLVYLWLSQVVLTHLRGLAELTETAWVQCK